jgi:hypothetical protein
VVTCGNFRKHLAAWLNFHLVSGKLASRRIILMPGHVIYLRFFQARSWEWAVYCNTFWDNKKVTHLKPDETSPSVSHTRDCTISIYIHSTFIRCLSCESCHIRFYRDVFLQKKNAQVMCPLAATDGQEGSWRAREPKTILWWCYIVHIARIYIYTDTEAWDYICMLCMYVCITTYI